jgi:hypothetical protein
MAAFRISFNLGGTLGTLERISGLPWLAGFFGKEFRAT